MELSNLVTLNVTNMEAKAAEGQNERSNRSELPEDRRRVSIARVGRMHVSVRVNEELSTRTQGGGSDGQKIIEGGQDEAEREGGFGRLNSRLA